MTKLTLFRKREIILPTLWGWLLLGSGSVLIGLIFLYSAQSFLAYHHPIGRGQVLIVEGWMPDYALEATYEIFQKEKSQYILTTGGPLERGSYLKEFHSFANLSAITLEKIGVPTERLVALPTPNVQKNRTIASALEVKKWLAAYPDIQRVNLVTLGVHARRSFYTFQKNLPSGVELGVITIANQNYPPDQWWLYSAGIRSVLYEGMAFIYVYLF